MAIVTLDDVKRQLNYDLADTTDDVELQSYADAITTVVEDFKGETIEEKQLTDELRLWNATVFLVRNVPVISLDAVETVDGSVIWNVMDLHVDSTTGLVSVLDGPPVDGLVQVTYTAGYAVVPKNFKRAALVIIQHNWETQRGGDATRRGVVVGGEEIYDPRSSYAIPRKALEWLGTPLDGVA